MFLLGLRVKGGENNSSILLFFLDLIFKFHFEVGNSQFMIHCNNKALSYRMNKHPGHSNKTDTLESTGEIWHDRIF